jgi:hypothetical protein
VLNVAPSLWDKCEGEAHTPKSGKLESFGTPKHSELDCKGQNTSHWGVLGVIEKVLKFRCPKWPHMSHLDIYIPSYGQKKGRKSNWQFDSRPLKVGNRPELSRRATRLLQTSSQSEVLAKSYGCPSGSPSRDNFETPPWESRDKVPFGCSLGGDLRRILHWGRWWLPSSPGRGESSVSKCPWLVPTPKGVPEYELTFLWLVLDADSNEIILVPLPSLIPGLLARPSTPF